MRRFQFNLQRVLDLWGNQADVEELRLHDLVARRRALDEQDQRITKERDDAERHLIQSPSVTATELMALESFRNFTVQQRRQIALQQAECDNLIEKQRTAVIEARRRSRLMEKLRERKQIEWKHESDRELDDIAAESFLARFVRQRPENG
jgi:flagellar export protein FliJ